jgi:L-proline amide hydrolase
VETILTIEGYVPFGEHQTWYRITGDLVRGKTPLVITWMPLPISPRPAAR